MALSDMIKQNTLLGFLKGKNVLFKKNNLSVKIFHGQIVGVGSEWSRKLQK